MGFAVALIMSSAVAFEAVRLPIGYGQKEEGVWCPLLIRKQGQKRKGCGGQKEEGVCWAKKKGGWWPLLSR